MDSFKKYFIKPWNSTAILSQAPLSRSLWLHLIMAYCTLGCCLVFALFGAYSQNFFDIGGWITALGFIGSLYWMSMVNPWNEQPRVLIFLLASHLFGLTIGPAINLIFDVDQGYIIKILMGAVLFCTCQFSALIHSLDRNVIYELVEFSTPIFITAWMVIYEAYPDFLVIVYILVLGLLSHMRMYNQESLYLAAHTTNENYYVNTTITFFTEFLARTISLIIHTVKLVMRVIRRYLKPPHNTLNHA